MHPRSALLPVVIAAGLAAASPAAAATGHSPVAHASGGDAPPVIPSIVQTRITRTENALERLTEYVDDQDAVKTAKVAKVIRRQTAAAWRGAKYYLRTAPPPVTEDALHARGTRGRAHVSQDDVVLPVIADQYTTAVAVFGLVHDVSAGMIEMTDGAHGNTLSAMSRTIFWTLDKRDAMVKDAETFEPPAPPVEDAARQRSGTRRLRQDDATSVFGPLMPEVTQGLDDELQHIDGLQADATDLRPKGKSILRQAEVQILLTERAINAFWPPAPVED
jgi:hypothetical protein